MDTLKYQTLLTIIETGSFSQAAEILGYTPSGINRMVNSLENEFGFPVFIRTTQGVTLTKEGTALLPSIRELVHWNKQIQELCADLQGLSTGHLTIGSYYSTAACWLPKIMQAFQSSWPGIQIDLCEGGNSDLTRRLENRQVDCCFFSEHTGFGDWIPLQRDELVAWLPDSHPFAKSSKLPLKALNGAPFIQPLPSQNTDLERMLTRHHLVPDIRFTTSDNYTAYAMVAAGLGISLNNALMARDWTGPVTILPFDPPQYISLGISLPSLKQASPALKKFIVCAKKVLSTKTSA